MMSSVQSASKRKKLFTVRMTMKDGMLVNARTASFLRRAARNTGRMMIGRSNA